MKSIRMAALGLAAGAWFAVLGAANAAYPEREVRIIVGYPPGGGSDIVARLLAQKLNEAWRVPVIVENKPGADSSIGSAALARSAPDGYTMGVFTNAFTVNKSLYQTLPYDPVRDFTPIGLVATTPAIVGVAAEGKVSDIRGLVELSKRSPGTLNYSTSSSITYVFGELFKAAAGIDATRISYKGSSPAVTAAATGEVTFGIDTVGAMMPLIRAGKMRVLAVAAPQRLAVLPSVPTMNEAGVKDLELVAWWGVFAPAGVPKEVVAKWSQTLEKIIASEDVQRRLRDLAFDAAYSTPAAFADLLSKEFARYDKIVTEKNLRIGQ